MIEKTPTDDAVPVGRQEYQPCEFHACMQECISARRHVTIENKLYTHEMSISYRIPTEDEYLSAIQVSEQV